MRSMIRIAIRENFYSHRPIMITRMKHFEDIDERLLEEVSAEARKTSRLRMNHNFHESLDDKCHRFVNAVEPGSVLFEGKEGPFVPHEQEGVMEKDLRSSRE